MMKKVATIEGFFEREGFVPNDFNDEKVVYYEKDFNLKKFKNEQLSIYFDGKDVVVDVLGMTITFPRDRVILSGRL